MSHLSDRLLATTLKIGANEDHKKLLAYLIYLTEELDVEKIKGVIPESELSSEPFEIELPLQYVKLSSLYDRVC